MLLGVSIVSILVVSVVAYVRSRAALADTVTNQLTSERETLAQRIEAYLGTVAGQSASMAESRMTVEALLELDVGWAQLADTELEDAEREALLAVHTELLDGLPTPAENVSAQQLLPTTAAGRWIQHRYATEDGRAAADAEDGTETFYERAHERFHPALSGFVERFDFYDLFLVSTDGRVLYTAEKELDVGTSLVDGPFRESNLARLVDDVLADPLANEATFTDYRFYAPSGLVPAAFVASPVRNPATGQVVGVVALQLSDEEVNRVMTAEGAWQETGLGDTGEAYLVGPDATMRSVARRLVEQPEDYLDQLRERGIPDDTVARIGRTASSVLLQPVRTEVADAAMAGRTETGVFTDTLGRRTLATAAPLELPEGLDWAIVTQVDVDEATAAVSELQRDLLVATGVIVLAVTGLAMLLASIFVRPIERLRGWVGRVRDGDLSESARGDAAVEGDEFGQLGAAFGDVVSTLHAERELKEVEGRRNAALLAATMPDALAERVRAGEEQIADDYPNVAVVDVGLTGFTALTTTTSAERAADVLRELAFAVDDAASTHGLERMKSMGGRHVLTCGMLEPRLDHRRRAVAFALDLKARIETYADAHGLALTTRTGIADGTVEAGVVGSTTPVFDLWGRPVTLAALLGEKSERMGAIRTTAAVAEHLEDVYVFENAPTIDLGHTVVEPRRLLGARDATAGDATAADRTPSDLDVLAER